VTDQSDAVARARAVLLAKREESDQVAVAWLRKLLEEGPRPKDEVLATRHHTQASLLRAKDTLGVVEDAGSWSLPEPKPQGHPTVDGKVAWAPREALPEELRTIKKAPTTALATELLRRKAYSKTLALLEMTERERRDEKCPACGRGMLRAEETRLRAILAVLDRAMPATKGGDPGEGSGPLIVFPPGSKIAILAQTGQEAETVAAERARDASIAEADAISAAEGAADAERVVVAVRAAERVQLRKASEL
jgi:hypothetical protein